MAKFASLLAVVMMAVMALAAPIPVKRAFQVKQYAAFQISSGIAGNAQAKANAVFVQPFANVDLTKVSQTDLNNMETMRVAAENAETNFNSAVAAAGGETTTAGAILQAGKIQNKVLKLTGLQQIDTIKIAQAKASGASTTTLDAALADINTKLAANVKIDVASKGKQSKSFLG